MSGGGGSSSDSGGGNDMQVSGMEAALSSEKGISTHADTRVSKTSFSPGGGSGNNQIDYADKQGNIVTKTIGYGEDQVDPKLAEAVTRPDRSTVGSVKNARINPNTGKIISGAYTKSEIEKGYTEEGEQLSNVNGKYMTKGQMYSTGIIAKDPKTGEDVMGNKVVDPQTGDIIDNPADATFSENFANTPSYLPIGLRFLMAGGKKLSDYSTKSKFEGFNEAGQRGLLGNAALGYGQDKGDNLLSNNFGISDRDTVNRIIADAPYIISGLDRPDGSPAADFFSKMNLNKNELFFQDQYNTAKIKVKGILENPSPMRYLAVSESPFYGWLKKNNLDKGIL